MTVSPTQSHNVLELDSDLASLASQAAIELDNVLLERAGGLSAVGRLAQMIYATVPAEETSWQIHYLDIGNTIAVNRAVATLTGSSTGTQLRQLLERARDIAARLSALPEHEERHVELKDLRAFCLELSRQAASSRRIANETASHPYRR